MTLKNFPMGTPIDKQLNAFRDWKMINKLPVLRFPEGWKVKLIPPFGDTLVRFIVLAPNVECNMKGKGISVYLDASCALGSVPEPYWEIYPNAVGDTSRFLLHETKEMFEAIQESLDAA